MVRCTFYVHSISCRSVANILYTYTLYRKNKTEHLFCMWSVFPHVYLKNKILCYMTTLLNFIFK